MRLESGILAFSQVLPLSTISGFCHFFLKSVILSEGAHWGVDQLVYSQRLQGKYMGVEYTITIITNLKDGEKTVENSSVC